MSKRGAKKYMNKLVHYRKSMIVLLILLVLTFIISALLLISASRYLANMIWSYPVPIDSFGTIDLGITFVIVFSILVIASAVGIVIGVVKLKSH